MTTKISTSLQNIVSVFLFILGVLIVLPYSIDDDINHYQQKIPVSKSAEFTQYLNEHRRIPGDLGDARFNQYVLEHFYLAITGKVDSFVNGSLYYPWTKTILFSDTHWGGGLVYVFFRSKLINSSPENAFLAWFIVGFILNYGVSFRVNKALGLKPFGASVGAFFFTFALPVLQQVSHAQLLYRFYIPLAFFTLNYYLKHRDPRLGALTLALIALQFLTSIYIGLFLCYFLIAYLISWRFFSDHFQQDRMFSKEFRTHQHDRFIFFTTGLILVFTFVCFFLSVIPYYQAYHLYSETIHDNRSALGLIRKLPHLSNYFMADNSAFWISSDKIAAFFNSSAQALMQRHEKQLFIGSGALLAVIYAILSKKFKDTNLLSKNMLITTMIVVIFTLSFGDFCFSLYGPVSLLPGITSVRVVSRIILVLVFPISLIIGQVIDQLHNNESQLITTSPIAFFLIALIVADSLFATKLTSKKTDWIDRIKQFEGRIHQPIDKDSIIVAAVSEEDPNLDNLDAMLYAQAHGIKTMNGYSGNIPLGYVNMKSCQDVADNIDAAEKFYREKLNLPFPIDKRKLIYVGFNSTCP